MVAGTMWCAQASRAFVDWTERQPPLFARLRRVRGELLRGGIRLARRLSPSTVSPAMTCALRAGVKFYCNANDARMAYYNTRACSWQEPAQFRYSWNSFTCRAANLFRWYSRVMGETYWNGCIGVAPDDEDGATLGAVWLCLRVCRLDLRTRWPSSLRR